MTNGSAAPACIICDTALSGPLGAVARLAGIRRSSGNPNICDRCNAHVAEGRIVELAVFFADLSDYTTMTETLGPERVHGLLDAYLRRANDVIVAHDGYVSQFVGDEVMAFFNVPVQRPDSYAASAVDAALVLREKITELGIESGQPLQMTVGIAAGHARVGRVGSESVAHYSAIGDVVNRAARLVSRVSAGGILVDESIYEGVADRFPDASVETVALKGFAEPVCVARIEGQPVEAVAQAGDTGERRIRLMTTLTALLSAPCVGFLALNSAAVAVGFGSLAAGAFGTFLDQSFIRIPMLAVASIGAIAILAIASRHRGAIHSPTGGLSAQPTAYEKKRTWTGIAFAVLALLLVVGEVIAHDFVEH